jgi:UDP-glucose 4-epimerase
MSVLVTGGAGYIGSHAVKLLVENGYRVVVIDNLLRGHTESVHSSADLEIVDLRDTDHLANIMQKYDVKSVMHFAGLTYVGESVDEPVRYYENNTAGSISLLKAMDSACVKQIVFSSTCATYGVPTQVPICETMEQHPVNPYGHSKIMIEQILLDKSACDSKFSFTTLRYFNVAGCAADGSIGEDHNPETHLIPLILMTALGFRDSLCIYGTDYPTSDGTCIRDYVHVEDLCKAHLLALQSMQPGDARFYNVGIGKGYSVLEVISASERVIGRKIPVLFEKRRAGDPPELYANAGLIRDELGWKPEYTQLENIIETAWKWFVRNPSGYLSSSANHNA